MDRHTLLPLLGAMRNVSGRWEGSNRRKLLPLLGAMRNLEDIIAEYREAIKLLPLLGAMRNCR